VNHLVRVCCDSVYPVSAVRSVLHVLCRLLQRGARPTQGAGTTGPRADVISSGARN
jgi:hypothetical protein